MTIQIGYIQWLRDNGYGFPTEPILRQSQNILNMDSVLAYDENGKPIEPEWHAVDVIIGNPPFLGGNRIRAELGDKYVDDLFKLYEGRVPAFADLVCYWFEKARAMIEEGKVQRVGLLATQAIRGGVNRKVLERIKETGDIFWAQSDRDWILNGATVHVSMIGFDKGKEKEKTLDNLSVADINPDLTSHSNLTTASSLSENLKLCFIGTKKAGDFDIEEELAKKFLAQSNPNGKPNSNVIFKWMNGKSIVSKLPQRWIIYFGDMLIEEASLYEAPFEYARKNIYPERQNNNEERARVKWWQHRRPASEMWVEARKLKRYIATPRVSKHRIFNWISNDVLPDDGVYIFARDDDYFFGILHSKLHELWARATEHNYVKQKVVFVIHPLLLLKPSPSRGLRGQNRSMIRMCKPLPLLQKNWLNNAIDGLMLKVSAKPKRKSVPSPTSTTPAPPGSISPTNASMQPSSPPMAGRMMYPMKRF